MALDEPAGRDERAERGRRIVHDRLLAAVGAVQLQVEVREGELPHLQPSTHEAPRGEKAFQQFVREGFARLMVAREEVESFTFPAPVLHDLRRDLDPVPRDVHAAARGDLHPGAGVVQQVAEFMEEGADFTMREQGRTGSGGRVEVAADEGQMRLEPATR